MFNSIKGSAGIVLGGALGFTGGIIAGGVIGLATGLLLAPKSGPELREDLLSGSEDLYNKAANSIDEIKAKAGESISNVVAKGEKLVQMASENLPA